MTSRITQPVNQVRLTNVAVVRMNRHGKRFEVACYRNKILNYRQGIETDLSEVLQTTRIFTNVSKGQFAPTSDLLKCFDTKDEEVICTLILDRGQVQVSDMERSAQLESTAREVADMVAAKCVDPASGRPYTPHQIREAMSEAEFCVQPNRGVKQQFLDCVRLIKQKGVLEIERAKMELCLVVEDHGGDGGSMKKRRQEVVEQLRGAGVEFRSDCAADGDDEGEGECRLTFLIDPSLYRAVDSIVKEASSSDGNSSGGSRGLRLEIVRQCVTAEGDVNLESEMERKDQMLELVRQKQQQQQQKGDRDTNGAAGPSEGDDGDGSGGIDKDENGVSALARHAAASMTIHDDTLATGDDDDEDDDTAPPPVVSARKSNKKAQKKSKKAKRREKEEAMERQARVEAEKLRVAERKARLGGNAAGGGEGGDNDDNDDAAVNSEGNNATAPAGSNDGSNKSCNTCGGSFTPAEYRAHFRSDWHRYNQKLKMGGSSPVGEEEFKLCDEGAFF